MITRHALKRSFTPVTHHSPSFTALLSLATPGSGKRLSNSNRNNNRYNSNISHSTHSCACALTGLLATFNSAIVSQHRFQGSNAISADEISFVEEEGKGGGSSGEMKFADVVVIDTFCRARVLNFVKRYPSHLEGYSAPAAAAQNTSCGRAVTTQESSCFEVYEVRVGGDVNSGDGAGDDVIYHARLRLPLPSEYGVVYGEGLANSIKDAEQLAAMHAERIIDTLGFQIYTLSSMQKKHAEAARKAGRWAPMPNEGLRDFRSVKLPPPLRRLVDRDESEGGKYQMVDCRPLPFRTHPHTLLSPAIVDPGALQRIKNYFQVLRGSLDSHTKITEIPPADKNEPRFFEAEITLTPLDNNDKRVALGKGTDRNLALILACMHAEMIIDACGGALFPSDNSLQQLHARTVRSYGRPVVLDKEPRPTDPLLPLPLKLYVANPVRSRVCNKGYEEDFVHKNLALAEVTTAFTNIDIGNTDGMAQIVLSQFLQRHGMARFKDPFLLERIGTQWRATVVLPVDSTYGIRGGVGIAEQPSDAEKLAAMHALDVLVALGLPVHSDPKAQMEWIEKRRADGRSLPPDEPSKVNKAMPSPPAYRRVSSPTLARPNAEQEAAAVPNTVSAPAADAFDPLPRRKVVDRSHWSLDPDTKDNFILVQPADAPPSSPPPGVTQGTFIGHFGHTMANIRSYDAMARNRIINYLAFVGKRPGSTFNFQKLQGKDGLPVHRCIIKLPVPPEVGDRLAVGEGPEAKDSEVLACMHAELILDNLGVPLYPEPSQQLKHATAVTSVGRYAPFPGDPLQAKNTPTPPPFRMLRQLNLAKGSFAQRAAQTATASRMGASTPPPPPPSPPSQATPAAPTVKPVAGMSPLPPPPPAPPKEAKSTSSNHGATTTIVGGVEHVQEADIDHNSKARVMNYLRRNTRVVPEPVITYESKGNNNYHVAKLWLPVPARFGQRIAQATAERKKDADVMCYMHAERIIDALGLHLFNLPGLQKRHVERVAKMGRKAPLPNEKNDNISDTVPTPPPLRLGTVVVMRNHPVASEMALQDFTAWGMYIKECEEYIDVMRKQYETECFERDVIPLTGDPFTDDILQDVSNRGTEKDAKSRLTNYCFHTNTKYPNTWKALAVGSLVTRRCFTMIPVPGYEFLNAYGVAVSKENSQRRAAMCAIEIIRRLNPEYRVLESSGALGNANASSDHSQNAKDRVQHENRVGSFDAQLNTFTNDGKVRVIELFTVCNALNPPVVTQKQKEEGGSVFFYTEVEVTDEDGVKWVGRADDTGSRRNEVGAYNDLFLKLSKNIPSFQSLMQLARTHPHLSPEHIVDLQFPPELATKIEKLVEGIDDDTVVDPVAPEVSVDVTTEDLVTQADATANPADVELRQAHLKQKYEEKKNNATYKEKFEPRRKTLSIYDKKDIIMETIINNKVTVVCGTTGCGKTTQLPQYILDYEVENGTAGNCNIVVTQPRRISAVSISQRIADERMEPLGDAVGYTIRLDSVPGKHVNFITSGVLLRIFQAKPNLDGIRYVIIDEIHERDINSDFLLILMREVMKRRDDLRLILMSATLQSELFSNFFDEAPVINVEGYVYPVQELFLEDIAKIAQEKGQHALIPSFKETLGEADASSGPKGSMQPFNTQGKIPGHRPRYGFMEAHSDIDYMAIEYAVRHVIQYQDMTDSSILVFLPGWEEIVRCKETLEKTPKYHLLLMHSSVNSEEQMKCFQPAPEGKVKIILSTNIAESGVTIDDIRAVIDVGRAKEKSFIMKKGRTAVGKNEMGSMSQLVSVYASRANCIQRRGRAGRTREGLCIRLYTRNHFDRVADFQTPEMLRQPLDSLCLQILSLGLGDPSVFLNKALEPPSTEAVEAAMTRLQELGATTACRRLTPLGLVLGKLPVAPRIGKVILMGAILKCLDSALTIAATAEMEIFNVSRDLREAVRVNREHMSCNSQSDHIASVNAFNAWTNKCSEEGTPVADIMAFVAENALYIPTLRIVSRYKKQFFDILFKSGYLGEKAHHVPKYQIFIDESEYSRFSHDIGLIKTVIAAGLFPNVAMFRAKKLLRNKFENSISPANASVISRTPTEEVRNPFFVYEEMSRGSGDANSRVNIRGNTSVSIWSILLFGATNAQLAFRDDLNLGLIDDWIVFRSNFEGLDLIKRFKTLIAKITVKKLSEPNDVDNNATIDEVCAVVRELVNMPLRPSNLVEEAWEERGVINSGKPVLIDPTFVVTPETDEEAQPAEGGSDEKKEGETADGEKKEGEEQKEDGIEENTSTNVFTIMPPEA